jgi:hypothetical protein
MMMMIVVRVRHCCCFALLSTSSIALVRLNIMFSLIKYV